MRTGNPPWGVLGWAGIRTQEAAGRAGCDVVHRRAGCRDARTLACRARSGECGRAWRQTPTQEALSVRRPQRLRQMRAAQ